MARLIILIAVLAIALIVWHKIKNARGEDKRKLVIWGTIGAVAGLLLILGVTGHLNIITAAIASLVAVVPRLLGAVRYLPFISKLYQSHKNNSAQGQGQGPEQGQQSNAKRSSSMGREQAMEVLGLKDGFNRDDVIAAHRRMMQKLHPDRGGSDYLASQINTAKDVLLG